MKPAPQSGRFRQKACAWDNFAATIIVPVLICLAFSFQPFCHAQGSPNFQALLQTNGTPAAVSAQADQKVGAAKLDFLKLLNAAAEQPTLAACSNLWFRAHATTNEMAMLAAELREVETRIDAYKADVKASTLDPGLVQELTDEADADRGEVAARRAKAQAFHDLLSTFIARSENQCDEILRVVKKLYGEERASARLRELLLREYQELKDAIENMSSSPSGQDSPKGVRLKKGTPR